mmetsp:Transcript_23283/g.38927  ORF Transcript_23283/g.38927 Transcript_23283/m.38927 type:complete len:355 (+) Transcript_23283:326-1390(+)|eukprot:CAMPEP_0198197856 /NCGR_PEP_ID=MMETSP1445-20131203/1418_1 /TAXON_ID=36898 /ORGANISM="Pyramimonas sp., Strain CCMP2087" /LENGTH=354 /DNA_ID=CAMNT_0043867259 /DNA_START=312 /DNA_END=1376 /DNA_ORIENTATION=+
MTKTINGLFTRLDLSKRDPVNTQYVEPSSRDGNESYEYLEEFKQLETLGTGTFGRVRIVQHVHNKQYFALKILKKSEIIRLRQVEHVLSEKAILNSVNHPFIIRLFKTYQDRDNVYMLLEYVPGGEIFSHLRRTGRFTNDAAKFYAGSITLALQYMHGKDIIYRDLKPENLLLDLRGNLKITDFGFAKKCSDRTWTLCGTPEYLAPEIIQSRGHGKGVDWWALGILIYEMLAGYPPFFDVNPFGIYQKILLGNMEFPRHFDPHAKDLVRKLCSMDRSKRFGILQQGAEDVKRHKWFKGFDFDALIRGQYTPPVVPKVWGAGDTQNYAKYPESEDPSQAQVIVEEETNKRIFKDF